MDCDPTWTRPMVGTSVPKYHSQPTIRKGCRLARKRNKADKPSQQQGGGDDRAGRQVPGIRIEDGELGRPQG